MDQKHINTEPPDDVRNKFENDPAEQGHPNPQGDRDLPPRKTRTDDDDDSMLVSRR